MTDLRPPPPGPLTHDEDGNPLPQPAENSDLRDLIALAEWCRAKGFQLGPLVRVGKITTQIRDLRQAEGKRDRDEAPDLGIWAENGFDPNG